MNKQNFFLKNSTFSQKQSLDAGIAVVTTREKIFFPTKRFMDQSPKKVWKIIYISKNVFPQKLPPIHRLRFSQLWQNFLLEVNIRSQSEKKSEFFSFEKNFHKLFPRTSIAVLPTLEKFFQHCPKNFENFSKILEFSRLPFRKFAL